MASSTEDDGGSLSELHPAIAVLHEANQGRKAQEDAEEGEGELDMDMDMGRILSLSERLLSSACDVLSSPELLRNKEAELERWAAAAEASSAFLCRFGQTLTTSSPSSSSLINIDRTLVHEVLSQVPASMEHTDADTDTDSSPPLVSLSDPVLAYLPCIQKSFGKTISQGTACARILAILTLQVPARTASWLRTLENIVVASQYAKLLLASKTATATATTTTTTDESTIAAEADNNNVIKLCDFFAGEQVGGRESAYQDDLADAIVEFLDVMLPELLGSGGLRAGRWRTRLAAADLGAALFSIMSPLPCLHATRFRKMLQELLDVLALDLMISDPQWKVRLSIVRTICEIAANRSLMQTLVNSSSYYWALLAAGLDEQEDVHETAMRALHRILIHGNDSTKLVVLSLIQRFISTIGLSSRSLPGMRGRCGFESSPDASLLISALVSVVHLQLLPDERSSDGADIVPILLSSAASALEETSESNKTLHLLLTKFLRSLCPFGYGMRVLLMLQSSCPLYIGSSVASMYRGLSIAQGEVLDIVAQIRQETILRGISVALETLKCAEHSEGEQKIACTEECDLAKAKFDVLQHIMEVLIIPSNFISSLKDEGTKSEEKEFLRCTYYFLRILISILEDKSGYQFCGVNEKIVHDLVLRCSAFASCQGDDESSLSWVSKEVQSLGVDAIVCIAKGIYEGRALGKRAWASCERVVESHETLLLEILPEILPSLKTSMRSGIDGGDMDSDDQVSAIIAAHQMFWCLEQVKHPLLVRLDPFMMPCILTAFDHYSPHVKRQAMKSCIHLVNHMDPSKLRWYKDVLLDASRKSIAGSGELWPLVVKMNVQLVTCLEGKNPRGKWYQLILKEMVEELQRHGSDLKSALVWLQHAGKLFESMGLLLVAHFRHLLPLLFKWMHSGDANICFLAIKGLCLIMKNTWPRIPSHAERLGNELLSVYRHFEARSSSQRVNDAVLEAFNLLMLCGGDGYMAFFQKHHGDSSLLQLIAALDSHHTLQTSSS